MIHQKFPPLLATLTALLLTLPVVGQQMMRLDADNSLMLREIGVIAAVEDGEIRVVTVMPGGHGGRQAKAADVTVRGGDTILMINGKRVRDLDAARVAYDAVAVGDEVKLAVRQDGRPSMVTFTKQAAEELDRGRVVMRMEVGAGGDPGDIRPLLGLGLVVRASGDQVSVVATLPGGEAFTEGDIIRRIAEKNLSTLDQLEEWVEAAEPGATLEVEVEREGQATVLRVEKQAARGRVMVREGA